MAGGVGHSLDQMFNGHGYRACQNTRDGVSGDLVMPACWPTISFGSNVADRSREGANARTLNFTTTQQSLANTWLLAAVSTTPELIQLQKHGMSAIR